ALRWAQHGVELSAEDEAAVAYLELGQALMRLSRLAEARDAFREAVSAARAGGQAVEEGRGLAGEALSIQLLGDFAGAVPLFVQASEIAERTADLEGLVMAKGNLAYQFLLAEQYDRAEDALRTCLRIEQQLGLSQHEPYTLAYLGDLRSMRGDHTEGLSLLNRALELAGPSYPRCESQVLIRRGDVELRMGEPHAALASYSRADEILREFSSTWVEIDCNNGLAETRLALGDPETAALLFQRARAASDEVGDPYESARALVGLGEISLQAGNVEVALEQWEAAALLFARLGSPAADRLSARVAELRGAS
ncbi:MAG: tetratricopeptide repeat protein, partial [Nocardioides sp.]